MEEREKRKKRPRVALNAPRFVQMVKRKEKNTEKVSASMGVGRKGKKRNPGDPAKYLLVNIPLSQLHQFQTGQGRKKKVDPVQLRSRQMQKIPVRSFEHGRVVWKGGAAEQKLGGQIRRGGEER